MELNVTEKKRSQVTRQTILARQSSDNNGGVITFQLHTADVVTIGDETIQGAWTPYEVVLSDEVYAIVCLRSGMTPQELAKLGQDYTQKFLMQLVNYAANPPTREEREQAGLPVPPLPADLPIADEVPPE